MRPVLALELSNEGILLHELSYDGKWRQLAAASLNDPFLPKKMAVMRATAKASQGRFFKNEVWVPEDHILASSVTLTTEEPEDRMAEAMQIFSADPSTPEGDYIIRLGQEDALGNTPIAAIERTTMLEAVRFAKGYGFSSENVTSATRINGFYQQPYFAPTAKVAPTVDTRKIGFVAAGILALGVLGAGAWWAYNNIDFSRDPSTAIEATEGHIYSAEEDPRAPIRPSEISNVAVQPTPPEVTPGADLATPPEFESATVLADTQVEQLALSSSTETETAPLSASEIVPVTAPQEAPIWANIGRPDDLPAPESNGLPTVATNQPVFTDSADTSGFTGGQKLATYVPRTRDAGFAITPRLSDILPSDESTVALAAQLRKLNDSFGLTQVRENIANVAQIARAVELQSLPAVVTIGRPEILPILRGGVAIADPAPTPIEAPIEVPIVVETPAIPAEIDATDIARLQMLPPVVTRGLPDLTPELRMGYNVAEVPDTPIEEIAPPITLSIEELQNLTAVVLNQRPPVLPILRGGIEIGAVPPAPVQPVEEIDPAIEIARIATLQAAPAVVLQGRPRVLPFLRGGLEINGEGSGIIAEAPVEELSDAARLRPLFRPTSIVEIASINDPAISDQAVTSTIIPMRRASNFSTKVEAMMASFAQTQRDAPRFTDTPRDVSVPTSANVAREATIEGGIDLRATSLIGVYGKPGDYKALIRQRGGKYTMVKVGDTLSGWTITAISESTVRIQKGSRNEVLKLPG